MTKRDPKKYRWPTGVEVRQGIRADGTRGEVGRVRYHDRAGAKRSATFDTPRDAADFQAKVRLDRRAGRLDDLDRGRETVDEFITDWWAQRAGDWALSTQKIYRHVLTTHIRPTLGDVQLRDLKPKVIDELKAQMKRDKVGDATIRKTLSVLQGALTDAVRWQLLEVNPAQPVKKPPISQRVTAVHPPSVTEVETLRAIFAAPQQRGDQVVEDQYGATLISVLAYLGLRPQEALALQWRHVRTNTVLIEQRITGDEVRAGQKAKGKPPRSVDLLAVVAEDLAAHRAAQGPRRPATSFVFPRPDGGHWLDTDYRNWRSRRFKPSAIAAGMGAKARPYDLRHLRASLMVAEQQLSIGEMAEQMGHTVEMFSGVYAHLMAEFKGQGAIDLDAYIRKTRAQVSADRQDTDAR